MRKAELTPKKLLLLPIIPALALGIVELVNVTTPIPVSAPVPTACVDTPRVPPPVVAIDEAPMQVPDGKTCESCPASL